MAPAPQVRQPRRAQSSAKSDASFVTDFFNWQCGSCSIENLTSTGNILLLSRHPVAQMDAATVSQITGGIFSEFLLLFISA
jgi:hypothetical protein